VNTLSIREKIVNTALCCAQLMCYNVAIFEFQNVLTTDLWIFKRKKSSDVTQKYL